jgi:hypothetical protein
MEDRSIIFEIILRVYGPYFGVRRIPATPGEPLRVPVFIVTPKQLKNDAPESRALGTFQLAVNYFTGLDSPL